MEIVDGARLAPLLIPIIGLVAIVERRRGASVIHLIASVLFVVYLCGAASETLLPVFIGPGARGEGGPGAFAWAQINLVPLAGLGTGPSAREQILLNVLLGVPFGAFVPAIWRIGSLAVLFVGLLFTVAIETLQLCENWIYNGQARTVDINDVILNWLGVAIGLAVFLTATAAFRLLPGRARGDVTDRR